jgi:primosomal protein N' (replication factor Y) (superfamily II helicase)
VTSAKTIGEAHADATMKPAAAAGVTSAKTIGEAHADATMKPAAAAGVTSAKTIGEAHADATMTTARVCRIVPDVVAVTRAFDYSVPDELRGQLRVGAIVRIGLHGRRVRGWVVADDVESEVDAATLRPVLAVTSLGPPEPVVELTAWAAHRYCGSRVALLRSASPPNLVAPATLAPGRVESVVPDGWPVAGSAAERDALTLAAEVRDDDVATLRWPPLLDRRLLVAQLLARDGSSLVVVADASRGQSLVRWLRRAGAHAVLVHSDLSAAERTRAWATAAAGRVVVVGGRVAALAPVPDLRAAVVVDDSDEALQEERTPTWHARELLAERARRAGARFAVVSAAPSVEAEVLATTVHAPMRAAEAAGWPRVEVVDRGEEPPGAGLLSERLARALHDARDAGAPAVCVLNRRGRVRLLACSTCRKLVRWDRDGAPVWDQPSDAPVEAGSVPVARPDVCPHCGGTRLRVLRSGVTRVREELAALLPGTTVIEVDTATAAIESDGNEVGVFVGTEAVLQRVEVRRNRPVLVAFLDFDQELLAPRSRAAEQALWLVVRAARLVAGHDRSLTRVLLQTRISDHEVVRAAVAGDPARVVEAERARRRAVGFPPFGGLAEISGSVAAVDAAATALGALGADAAVTVLGPDRRGETARALVRGRDPDVVADALAAAIPPARALGRLHVEVDPTKI